MNLLYAIDFLPLISKYFTFCECNDNIESKFTNSQTTYLKINIYCVNSYIYIRKDNSFANYKGFAPCNCTKKAN